MTFELTMLAWACVLALVQILAFAVLRTRELGLSWNAGARDGVAAREPGVVTARLQRAQANLFETLPVFAALILIAHVAARDCAWTRWGAGLYLLGRVVYVPLYALGVPYARTLAWMVALVGILLVLAAVIRPA